MRQIGERTVSRIWEICGEPKPLFGEDNRMNADERVRVSGAADRPVSRVPDPFDDSRWEDDAPRYGRPRRAP